MFPIKTKVSHEQTFYLAFRNASLLSRFFFKNVVVRNILHIYINISTILVLTIVLNFCWEPLFDIIPLTFDRYRMDCVNDKKRKNLALYIVGKGIPNYWIEETRSLLNIENFETGTRFSKLSFPVYIPEFTLIYIIQFYYMGEKTVLFSFQVKNWILFFE